MIKNKLLKINRNLGFKKKNKKFVMLDFIYLCIEVIMWVFLEWMFYKRFNYKMYVVMKY